MTDSFYAEFITLPVSDPTTAVAAGSKLAPSARSVEQLSKLVLATVASVMGSEIGLEQPLVEAGLDSLGKLYNHNFPMKFTDAVMTSIVSSF